MFHTLAKHKHVALFRAVLKLAMTLRKARTAKPHELRLLCFVTQICDPAVGGWTHVIITVGSYASAAAMQVMLLQPAQAGTPSSQHLAIAMLTAFGNPCGPAMSSGMGALMLQMLPPIIKWVFRGYMLAGYSLALCLNVLALKCP